MRSSHDETVTVLNGWKDDKRVVALFLSSHEWRNASGAWRCTVVEATAKRLLFFGNGVEIGLYLHAGTNFDWQDPSESPPELREESSATYEAFLEISDPEYRCLLAAFKRPDERAVDTSVSKP